jgi:thioredoxin reductase
MLDVAVVGAGPYGLSVAAYLRNRGLRFRVFGQPMDSWTARMPKGMMLKSDGFASNLYDPAGECTLKKFCSERGIEYADTGVPVRLETFRAYGLAFQKRMVPDLEDKLVGSIERLPNAFLLKLENGEALQARRVVLAVGITHFEYLPEILAPLPPELLSHSARHQDLSKFRGRKVVVMGGGASALDLAGLLGESGADVQLVSRRPELRFHNKPTGRPRSWWQQLRHPQSGLGPGMRSRFFSDAPLAFHHLPERLRLLAVKKTLGPSGGWYIKDKVIGRVPTLLGCTPEIVSAKSGMAHLSLRMADGSRREIATEHIIAATGYKPSVARLTFLSQAIRSAIRTVNTTPVLSSSFESSVPGLYFVGIAASNSFGPVMRFAFGAGFAAERVTGALTRSLSREPVSLPSGRLVSETE